MRPVASDAVRLGGILDQFQMVAGAEPLQFGQIHGIAIQMYGNDGAGLLRDPALHGGDVEMKGFGIDIGEHRHRANVADRFRGGKETVGGDDDLIAGPDVGGLEGQFQGRGSGADADRVLGAGKAGKLFFEFLDVFSADKMSGVEYAAHRVQNLRP